jgi:hypothetical protein
VSRIDPFDHAFAELAEARFAAVGAEATATRRDTSDRAQFATLSSVQRILAELESPEAVERDPEAAEAYLTILFVAYRYWEAGRQRITVTAEQVENALRAASAGAMPPVPHGACYLQLPERWCWAQIAPDAPHEPLDGLFVVATEARGELTVVAVLGLRPDRPGFSEITVVAREADVAQAAAQARTPPLAPVIDGGEAAGLKSVVTEGEVLHLTALALQVSWD